MIKYEFYSLIHNKRKMFIIVAFILIVCVDVALVYKNSFIYEYAKNPVYDLNMVYRNTDTPSTAAFLSNSSRGHIPQMIIIWLLPFYFLFICSDQHIKELKYHYYQLLRMRENQRTLFLSKILFSFLVGFIVMFIALLINYILCFIVFGKGLNQNCSAEGVYWFLSDQYPIMAYVCYMFITSFIVGLYSSAMTSLSFLVKYRIPLYIVSFILWYLQINSTNSLTFVFQPFIEYGLSYIIPAFLTVVIGSVGVIIVGYLKVKYYDLD